jgi:hypothetical protein
MMMPQDVPPVPPEVDQLHAQQSLGAATERSGS